MRRWHDFLDSLDSDGGHIFLLLVLVIGNVVLFRFGFTKAETIVAEAFGALLYALKTSGSNKQRRDEVVSTATVETKTEVSQ